MTQDRAASTRQPRSVTFTPRVDILETPEGLVLSLDMPGVKPGDVDVRFERGELVVHGRCQPTAQKGTRLATEYETGDYYRAFIVSQEVDADKIAADLKNGVLTVQLPNAEAARARRIPVQGS
jgi:HSP20 family molecular chaperone IbpA